MGSRVLLRIYIFHRNTFIYKLQILYLIMLAVVFFSAVSVEATWGELSVANCKDRQFADGDATKECLNGVGGKSWYHIFSKWGSKTCDDLKEKKAEYCVEESSYAVCCGGICKSETTDTAQKCSANFGFTQEEITKIEDLDCDSEDTEDTTCTDKATELNGWLNITSIKLECKEKKCALTAAPKDEGKGEEGTKPKGTGEKDGKKDNESNAFALGLSTLAGALVLLQL